MQTYGSSLKRLTDCHPGRKRVRKKKSTGNMSRIRMNVYFRLRSERLNLSSQFGPQNSLSNAIGVAQTTQCLCFGIDAFVSCFMYFDIADSYFVPVLLNSVGADDLPYTCPDERRKCSTSSSHRAKTIPFLARI
jgi:hypothetical protein